ncbi:uncharacterized protein RSE6_01706 [Rhynchosporium secalis]|uniref:Uncharacterized protein n=1 Tax=Rhynchosporium secalis TaxID=38038 RepID=A0A1E1LYE7_RHYSE|nr:uncharacterized protein RSE6_01706 [Rhynchosporium secalis]
MDKALPYLGYLGTNREVLQLDSNIYGNAASAVDLDSHAKAASGLSHSIQDLSEDSRMMSRFNSQYKEFDSFQDDPVGWNVFSRGPETFHVFSELPLELRTVIFVEAANAGGFVPFKISKSLSICQESQLRRPLIEKWTRTQYKRMWLYHYKSITLESENRIMFVCKDAFAAFKLAKPNRLKWMLEGNAPVPNPPLACQRSQTRWLEEAVLWSTQRKALLFSQSDLAFDINSSIVDYINAVYKVEDDKRPTAEKRSENYVKKREDAQSFELRRMYRTQMSMKMFFKGFAVYLLRDKSVSVWIEDEHGVAHLQVKPPPKRAAAATA